MVEDDTFTYHVRQQSADRINKAAPSLITKERTQKLDLLIHLLSNLAQALVVCGPEGIGKTTLLKILQERKTESWRYCLIQGNAALSFEAVQEHLVKAQLGKSVSTASARATHQYKQVVLIIDNAGELVPGLIATIIQYGAANPLLRVIFALTHDELQVKRGSDRAIDDCHVIEVPSLSEKQCGDFLRHLSTLPYANLSFKAIGDNMIAHIYRKTHGVPGRIIAEVSGLPSGAKQDGKLKWILAFAVTTAIAVASGVQWFILSANAPGIALPPASMQSSKDNDKKVIAPATIEHKADNIEAAPSRPESQAMLPLPSVQPVIPQQPVPVNEGNKAKEALAPSVEVNVNRNDQQPVIPTAKPETASSVVDKPLVSDALPPPVTAPVPTQASKPAMPEVEQEKPKQQELNKTGHDVEPSKLGNSEVKPQPKQITAAEGDQKQANKQADVVRQKATEQLWAAREKLKQTESSKTVNTVEPPANTLELIQIPQKPVEVAAVPGGQPMETASPLQPEPEESVVQPADNFTLQLMVLSKQSSVNDIFKKYPAMASDIRVINVVVNGKEKFILEYGSYSDAVSANQARQSLPFEFRRALVRKINSAKHR